MQRQVVKQTASVCTLLLVHVYAVRLESQSKIVCIRKRDERCSSMVANPDVFIGVIHVVFCSLRARGSRSEFQPPKEGAIVEWFKGGLRSCAHNKQKCYQTSNQSVIFRECGYFTFFFFLYFYVYSKPLYSVNVQFAEFRYKV